MGLTNTVKNRLPDCFLAVCWNASFAQLEILSVMKLNKMERIIGLDLQPDRFDAEVLIGAEAARVQVVWACDRQQAVCWKVGRIS